MNRFNLLVLLALVNCPLLWATPTVMKFQGRLTDSEGSPICCSPKIRVAIYSSETGGVALWGPKVKDVESNAQGLFSRDLGPFTMEDIKRFSEQDQLFLEVSIRAKTDWQAMRPRQRITSVPFSFHASHASQSDFSETVAEDSIDTVNLRDEAITSEKIKDRSIEAVDLASNSVASFHIIDNSLGSEDIRDGSLQWVDLSTDAVRLETILNESIDGTKLKDLSIASRHIQNGSIQDSHLQFDAVTSDAIKKNAVTKDKIAPYSIDEDALTPAIALKWVPSGMIAMFVRQCPEGWKRFHALEGRFPFGAGNQANTPGGSPVITGLTADSAGAHSHTVNNHTHDKGTLYADSTPNLFKLGKGGKNVWVFGLSLPIPIRGQTGGSAPGTNESGTHNHPIQSDGSWLPPYHTVFFCQKN